MGLTDARVHVNLALLRPHRGLSSFIVGDPELAE